MTYGIEGKRGGAVRVAWRRLETDMHKKREMSTDYAAR